MPRFSEAEKEIIKQKLLSEAERLFTVYGIKKVSIDELVQATGIAKGSFYSFYSSKEQLFIEIVFNMQKKMWCETDKFLKAHSDLPSRELVKQAFIWMFEQLDCYPLIRKIDRDTTEYLFRKLPKEVVEAHTLDDLIQIKNFENYGVSFTCGIEIAAKILQILALGFINLNQENEAVRIEVMNTVLNGVLKEIVGDKND
ncbi:DNA-binding transcriptional repressor AcrR [Oxobacter pfennigii]|uniref:DNA-binding transcriptional repressor AcrR n=1 Tax=Oxobacter pfennigii TaxID=36849 RepID=A0A0P8X0X2_9CLOT|nr:TetR/AcrR family transcriptional regulator [Oxobacter pfennigii]KPU44438.1 DNA-binding transcriptional repressor AcrR [Oxobacter pfennigii]